MAAHRAVITWHRHDAVFTDNRYSPRVRFGAEAAPDVATLTDLHHAAHDACFLARSVKTRVRCEPAVDGVLQDAS